MNNIRQTTSKPSTGTVFLVGAGPGDVGLITVRGLELVKTADVIVYDQLGAPSFLSQAKPGAELVDVGKRSGDHTLSQDEINALLVKKAGEGKMVVRLKGGDPMIFGRGGEELQVLKDAGIPFESVPGISSSIAGPTYAGIPLTHRAFTSELAIVTGHEADIRDKDPHGDKIGAAAREPLPWDALARLRTVVFLMGVKQLPVIAQRLRNAGKPGTTPVAVIEQATLPMQRTVVGTLETIPELAQKAGVKPPSIIVVGEVVGLREQLQWFEKRPLFGRTIAVTRSRKQASDLLNQLEKLGARVLACPTIRIEKISPNPDVDELFRRFTQITHLIFTSTNGVEGFLEHLFERRLDLRHLHGKKIVCIGPATADVFSKRGLIPDFIPETYVAESLLPYFEKEPVGEAAILRAEAAREILPEALKKAGWKTSVIPLYRTLADAPEDSGILDLLKTGKVDAVTFSSSSTVDRFLEMIAGTGIDPTSVPAVSIGPVTTDTCRKHGFRLLGTAGVHTIPGLIDKLLELFSS